MKPRSSNIFIYFHLCVFLEWNIFLGNNKYTINVHLTTHIQNLMTYSNEELHVILNWAWPDLRKGFFYLFIFLPVSKATELIKTYMFVLRVETVYSKQNVRQINFNVWWYRHQKQSTTTDSVKVKTQQKNLKNP